MRCLFLIMFVFFSFTACSKEADTSSKKKTSINSKKMSEVKTEVPCDSKEDILKKLEEKKKLDEEKGKGFSLQGGSTGCSVK